MTPLPHIVALSATMPLAACGVAPTHRRPDAQVGAAFKGGVPGSARWKRSEPGAELARGESWTIFGDPKVEEPLAEAARAELDHALSVPLGKTPAELALAPRPLAFEPIAIPPGLPSTVLERRPATGALIRAPGGGWQEAPKRAANAEGSLR